MDGTLALVGTAIVLVGAFAIYFAPAIVASRRRHRNATSIAALNFLLGWSLIGWAVALVWALSNDVEK